MAVLRYVAALLLPFTRRRWARPVRRRDLRGLRQTDGRA